VPRRITTASPLYFAHIPKTAGTSLTAWLDSLFAPDEIWPAAAAPTAGRPPEHIRLIRGHFWNGSGVVPIHARRITVLRSPTEQFLSHFEHIRRNAGHPFNENALRIDRLTEIADDPMLISQLWNTQTRFLAADIDEAGIERVRVDGRTTRGAVYHPGNYIVNGAVANDVLLDLALRHLDGYLAVGVVERLEEFVRVLARLLGTSPTDVPHLNVTSRGLSPRTLAADELALVHRMTELDETVYRRAEQLHARLVADTIAVVPGHETDVDTPSIGDHAHELSEPERELARLRAQLAAQAEVIASLRFEVKALQPHVEWLTGVKDRMHARLEELTGSRALRAVGVYWRTIDRLRGRRPNAGEH
jgi:hypothetical protein